MLGVLSSSARYWPQYRGHAVPHHCAKTKDMDSPVNYGCGLWSGIGDSGTRSVTVRHGFELQHMVGIQESWGRSVQRSTFLNVKMHNGGVVIKCLVLINVQLRVLNDVSTAFVIWLQAVGWFWKRVGKGCVGRRRLCREGRCLGRRWLCREAAVV